MRKALLLIAFLATVCGCAPNHPSTSVNAGNRLRPDPVSDAALLWNGLIGVRVGPDGTSDAGAERLPLFAIDSYQLDGEEKIVPLESPLNSAVMIDGVPVRLSESESYESRLDMRTGVLRQSARVGGATVTCETVMHPSLRILAQRWTVAPQSGRRVEYLVEARKLDAKSDPPWESRVAKGVDPAKDRFVGESVWSWGESKSAPVLRHPLRTDRYREPVEAPATPPTFDEVAAAAARSLQSQWATDIEIDGPPEDQEAVRSFLYYLRSSIATNGSMSVSPFGLSHTMYNGHVFWDADVWVAPALAFVDPAKAAAISRYRLARIPGAKANYEEWLAGGRSTASGPLGHAPAPVALMFPWESSVTGKESLPGGWGRGAAGPSRHEAHITGSVVWSLEQSHALGLVSTEELQATGRLAAEFYLQRMRRRPDGVYEMPGVMSPDENHTGDNDLYTNLLAKHLVDTYLRDRFPNGIAVKVPRDGMTLLTYDNDPVRSYKQAAAILAIYPLQNPEAERQAAAMMERFAPKVIENGPAMSQSIDAIVWARIGNADQAYGAWRRSWKEFVRPPHMLFAEKRRNGRTYFTTGAAGSLQAVIYGFLGFRIDSQKDPAASWAKKLNGERWLTIKPNLPTSWRSVKFKNFTVLGQRYTLLATHGGLKVTQGD